MVRTYERGALSPHIRDDPLKGATLASAHSHANPWAYIALRWGCADGHSSGQSPFVPTARELEAVRFVNRMFAEGALLTGHPLRVDYKAVQATAAVFNALHPLTLQPAPPPTVATAARSPHTTPPLPGGDDDAYVALGLLRRVTGAPAPPPPPATAPPAQANTPPQHTTPQKLGLVPRRLQPDR
jgi:hypothetical protein